MQTNKLSVLENCNLLYLEDNDRVRESMGRFFGVFCKNVVFAKDYDEALRRFEEREFHIAVCDIELESEKNGLEFIGKVRAKNKDIQILVLSARKDERYLFEAITLNLTGYIVKPASFDAIQKALMDCANRIIESMALNIRLSSGATFCIATASVIRDGDETTLGEKEFLLLKLLSEKRGKIVTKEEIDALVYENAATDQAIKSLLNKLRRKVGEEAIITIPNIGYRLNVDDRQRNIDA